MIARTSGTSMRRQLPWTRRRASCSRQALLSDLQSTCAAWPWLTLCCAGGSRGFCGLKSHARCYHWVGRCHRHICRLHVHGLWCAMLLAPVLACLMPWQSPLSADLRQAVLCQARYCDMGMAWARRLRS